MTKKHIFLSGLMTIIAFLFGMGVMLYIQQHNQAHPMRPLLYWRRNRNAVI